LDDPNWFRVLIQRNHLALEERASIVMNPKRPEGLRCVGSRGDKEPLLGLPMRAKHGEAVSRNA